MASAIIDRIPKHKTYAEVFGGAAWVLFKKPPIAKEVLNDLDRHLMNFYRVTKYHLEALIEEVCALQLGRDHFKFLRDELDRPAMTDIQRAAAYYFVQRQAFSGRPGKPSLATFHSRPVSCRQTVARTMLPLAAERLKAVFLENLPWERFVKLYDNHDTFFFVDPPYIGHTEYRHNLKLADFEALADTLKNLKGRFLMTHTDSPEIRALFHGLNFETIDASYQVNNLISGKKHQAGKEILISNY